MAAICPAGVSPRLLGQDKDGFPPRGYVTFNEVVSSFNKCGNVASRRHGKLFLAQQTRMPSNVATIHDNTVNLRPESEREQHKQSVSSRGSRTPSPWPTHRRPWSQPATPRGAGTPVRGSRQAELRSSRDYWPSSFQAAGPHGDGLGDAIDGDLSDRSARSGRETFVASRPRSARPSGAKYGAGERSTMSSVATTTAGSLGAAAAASSRSAGSRAVGVPEPCADTGRLNFLGGRGDFAPSPRVSLGSRPEFAGASPRESLGAGLPRTPPRARSASRGRDPSLGDCALPPSPVARSRTVIREPCSVADSLLGSVSGSQVRPLLRPPAAPGSAEGGGFRDVGGPAGKWPSAGSAASRQNSREPMAAARGPSADVSPMLHSRDVRSSDASRNYPLQGPVGGSGVAGGDQRAPSFLRLNGFLLRTHVTSLVSALAEDGWLEPWEKERLCRQAREDSHHWSAFLRIYSRLMETEDVQAFVAGLRAQVA